MLAFMQTETALIDIVKHYNGQIPIAFWTHLSPDHYQELRDWHAKGYWEASYCTGKSIRAGALTPKGHEELCK